MQVGDPWQLLGLSELSTRNRAMKTGICRTRGRQPASGLAPCSFQSAIISWLSFSLSFLYLACSSFIFGCNTCIARWFLICLTNSGNSTSRIAIVRKTIDRAHAQALWLPKTSANTVWMCTTSQAMAS